MTHMNVVRFIVKPDRINAYLDKLKSQPKWKGQIEGRTIQTGDNTFCGYGLWESKEAMDAEMHSMISWLDSVRDMLEEISPDDPSIVRPAKKEKTNFRPPKQQKISVFWISVLLAVLIAGVVFAKVF